ncbi:MAG: exodeoxyribonuclease VII small subunit [Opitutales bacterium]
MNAPESDPPPPEDLSFEQAMAELESIVADLEAGRSTLDELITRYARGAQLLKRSRELLGAAETRLSQLSDDGLLTPVSDPET